MSVKNGRDYLYLIWKDEKTRNQYIVGELSKNGKYEFRYCHEFEEAKEKGFTLLLPFDDSAKVYESEELFQVFSSRLPDRKRKDIDKILEKYSLDKYDSYELLKASGAILPIDNLQFIDPILNFEKPFEKKFYIAGVRHYIGCDSCDCKKSIDLCNGEELYLECEPENFYDQYAIKIKNKDGVLLGYIPRYYSEAYTRLMQENRVSKCYVVKVNKESNCRECVLIKIKVE